MRMAGLSSALFYLVVVGLAAGCTAHEPPRPEERLPMIELGEEAIAQQEPIDIGKQMEGLTGIVEMEVTDERFTPQLLSVAVGATVRIHLRNAGTNPHNLIIPRFRVVTSNLPPGGENYIEFTASQKGAWPFYSDAPGVMEPGLQGALQVE